MPKLRAIFAFILFLAGPAFQAIAAEEDTKWTVESESGLNFNVNEGTITYTNVVTVRHAGATLTADRAQLNQKSGDILAEGNVRIEWEGKVWYGQRAEFNFKTRRLIGSEFRTGERPFFMRGDAAVGDRVANVYVLANGLMTTDDYEKPGYSVRAKSVTIVPGEYVECTHAILYVGDTPVFWLPKFRRTLKKHPNHFVFTPGYRSKYGPYLLTSYEWYWNERLDGALHLDTRYKRGLGGGPDVNYHLPRFGEGQFKYYYADDQDPGRDGRGEEIDDERQRIWFSHIGSLRTNLTVRTAVRYQSDSLIVRDFFESEYKDNTQPTTFVELNQLWSNWSLNLLTQPRVNNFQETVERLPDVKLTGLRQRFGGTPVFYESESSAGYFQREFAYVDTNQFAAFRADTYHQFLIPWTMFGWLNLAPRAGLRYTYYGETSGPGFTSDEQERTVFNSGAEASFKASRTWAGTRNEFFQIEGTRHIVKPTINYAWVPRPNVVPTRLPQFDYELPSAQLLPITYPDYNSIDSIDSQNVVRFGLENKLQTKRAGEIENVVHWLLYSDWRLHPRDTQETFSDLYSKLDLKPFHRILLSSEINYDINNGNWDQLNHSATLSPNDIWSWSLGHRYLRDGAFYGTNVGNNILFSSLYLRASQNWAARAQHYYNARDGFLQGQYYSIYRDLRSWTVALTVRVLRDETGSLDYGGAITFSSKAAPRFQMGDDINKPTQLLGY
ncbi:MAG TPA: LPS assembly protein LptD [Verrucomicrobiae bacterium]|nr:LPS assembly protein LptD [Verrucomicrobiae bacterium]